MQVKKFMMHNEREQSVLFSELLTWRDPCNPSNDIFGPVVKYTWEVDGLIYHSALDAYYLLLPDASGFICIEKNWRPDNCVLLNAQGNERIRLTVPWELTEQNNPASATEPTSFINVSAPYLCPLNDKVGDFGVTAWVEYAGKYYFELDYRTGKFLWGRQILD